MQRDRCLMENDNNMFNTWESVQESENAQNASSEGNSGELWTNNMKPTRSGIMAKRGHALTLFLLKILSNYRSGSSHLLQLGNSISRT